MYIRKYKSYIINENVNSYVSGIMIKLRTIYKTIKIGKTFIDLTETFGISFIIDIKKNNLKKIPLYFSNMSIKEILK